MNCVLRASRRILLGYGGDDAETPIPTKDLPNLLKYKYSGVDLSPISRYILNPLWNRMVTFVPLWVAPNVITLSGLLLVVSCCGVVLWHAPDLNPATILPSWVYFYVATCVWMAAHLDAIDGKQARRTGMSGPLGELFDHGCDCITVILLGLISPVLFQIGSFPSVVALTMSANLAFYGSTWEEFHTGTLYLGYVSAPVEGNLVFVLLCLLSGWRGGHIWSQPVQLFGYSVPPNITVASVIMFFSLIAFIGALRTVYKLKGIGPFAQLIPIGAFCLSTLWLVLVTPELARPPNNILFLCVCGLTFASSLAHLIVSCITKGKFRWWIPSYLTFIVSLLRLSNQKYNLVPWLFKADLSRFLLALFVFSSVSYATYAYQAIDQICSFLNIRCFKVTRKPESSKQQ